MAYILTIGDTYSYNTTCPLLGHSGGSDPLSTSSPNDFVFIDGKLVVPINTTHSSSCPMGCSMTITGTPQTHVTINGILIACDPSPSSMGGCHPSVTTVSECQNNWVNVNG